MNPEAQLIVSGVSLVITLVLILAVVRTSISTHRTAKLLEETNELLGKISRKQ